jgi:hypothetical protein
MTPTIVYVTRSVRSGLPTTFESELKTTLPQGMTENGLVDVASRLVLSGEEQATNSGCTPRMLRAAGFNCDMTAFLEQGTLIF